MYTNNQDIILLPKAFKVERSLMKIPRGQACHESLAANGLIGKICLTSDMTKEDVLDEIRCVFSVPMNQDPDFPVNILQMSHGGSKALTVPVVSPMYRCGQPVQWLANMLRPPFMSLRKGICRYCT